MQLGPVPCTILFSEMPKLILQRQPKQMRVLAGGVAAAAGSAVAPAPNTGADRAWMGILVPQEGSGEQAGGK